MTYESLGVRPCTRIVIVLLARRAVRAVGTGRLHMSESDAQVVVLTKVAHAGDKCDLEIRILTLRVAPPVSSPPAPFSCALRKRLVEYGAILQAPKLRGGVDDVLQPSAEVC